MLKVTSTSYLCKAFESLINKIQSFQRFNNFRRFRVFVLCFRANPKSEKRRKFQKTLFQWEVKEWGFVFMGLNWYSDEKFPKRYTYPKNSLVGNNECHLEE